MGIAGCSSVSGIAGATGDIDPDTAGAGIDAASDISGSDPDVADTTPDPDTGSDTEAPTGGWLPVDPGAVLTSLRALVLTRILGVDPVLDGLPAGLPVAPDCSFVFVVSVMVNQLSPQQLLAQSWKEAIATLEGQAQLPLQSGKTAPKTSQA